MRRVMINWRILLSLWLVLALNTGCGFFKEIQTIGETTSTGLERIKEACVREDTLRSVFISGADAVMDFMDERYEVSISLYSVKDSFIYVSAVNSGYEIVRAMMDEDSIKVIDRINRIVYRTPLKRQFGHQYPMQFTDIQHIISKYYICDLLSGSIEKENKLLFDMDTPEVKKRIQWNSGSMTLDIFEFYHKITGRYVMGERTEGGMKVYFNFLVNPFELTAWGGETLYNRDILVKMEVNKRRYTFTDLR